MGDLQPLGSEKLQGMDKINRILEIARFKENTPSTVNETSRNEYKLTLADGNEYQIVKEKVGYIIKKTLSESTTDYIEPMKNRKYYPSYSQALKRLNLMAKEMNSLHENEVGTSLFSEQKKFVLKTPMSQKKSSDLGSDVENVPPPPAEPAGDMAPPPPPPAGGDMGGDMPPPSDDMGDTAPPPPSGDDMGDTAPADDMGDEHEEGGITFKTIQKLTGKLGQKLRGLESQGDEPMSSKDIKYVINSILSALNLDSLEDEDKEEIMNKFDGEEDMGDEDMGDSDMSDGDMGDEDMGDTAPASIDTGDEEQPAGEMGETWDALGSEIAGKSLAKAIVPGQFSEGGEMEEDHIGRIADELFVENKVENILSKYFTITESEKKFNNKVSNERKTVKKITSKEIQKEIKRLSENVIQEVNSRKFLNENKNAKLIGKTNKRNLVFEIGNKQFKVLTNGNII